MAIKTVIDTNVVVAFLSSKSKHHWLIEFLLYQRIELFVTEDILLEYEEVLKWKYSEAAASNFLAALRELPNVFHARVYYRWNLIRDPGDNKFVDCYITAGADYLITHDRHFAVLASVPFPKVNVVRIDQFQVALNIHQ
jgi:putative PIN family toxin of toxin-antitoxin system